MKFQYGVLRVGISRIAIEDYFVVSSSISKSAFLESFSVFHNNGILSFFGFFSREDTNTVPKNNPLLSCSQKCHSYCPIPNLPLKLSVHFMLCMLCMTMAAGPNVRIRKPVFVAGRRPL
jgi:hypothetical protein